MNVYLALVIVCCFPLVTPRALVRGIVIHGEPGILLLPWIWYSSSLLNPDLLSNFSSALHF